MGLFDELKRRNVFRVAIGYIITAWLLCRVRNLLRTDINTAKRWVIKLPTLQEF